MELKQTVSTKHGKGIVVGIDDTTYSVRIITVELLEGWHAGERIAVTQNECRI